MTQKLAHVEWYWRPAKVSFDEIPRLTDSLRDNEDSIDVEDKEMDDNDDEVCVELWSTLSKHIPQAGDGFEDSQPSESHLMTASLKTNDAASGLNENNEDCNVIQNI